MTNPIASQVVSQFVSQERKRSLIIETNVERTIQEHAPNEIDLLTARISSEEAFIEELKQRRERLFKLLEIANT